MEGSISGKMINWVIFHASLYADFFSINSFSMFNSLNLDQAGLQMLSAGD